MLEEPGAVPSRGGRNMTDVTTQLPLKLSYRLTRDDVAAFERLPRELSGPGKLAFLLAFFAIVVVLATQEDHVRRFVPESLAEYQNIVAIVFAVVISYGAMTLALTLLSYWRIARVQLPHSETEIEATEANLKLKDGSPSRILEWSLIARVIETPRHVFLCLTPRKAVIVPLRAFHSIDAMRAFADLSETLSRRADGDA